jgi:hypothetical protein
MKTTITINIDGIKTLGQVEHIKANLLEHIYEEIRCEVNPGFSSGLKNIEARSQTSGRVSYAKWEERFVPKNNPFFETTTGANDVMLETYGIELEYVKKVYGENPACVWTLVDVDGKLYITPGYHYVNRVGYFITELPCPDGVVYNVLYG